MNLKQLKHWEPPEDWKKIWTLDVHTGGEPLRIIISDFPVLKGRKVLDVRNDCKSRFDHFRRALMLEPRGHDDMYGCVIAPPFESANDLSVFFIHNEGYSTMCGHAIIAISKVVVQTGMFPLFRGERILRMETPAGLVIAKVTGGKDNIQEISFQNVPSFVFQMNRTLKLPGKDPIPYDLAFGGAFYALVDVEQVGLTIQGHHVDRFVALASKMKDQIQKEVAIRHPFEADLSFLYGIIFSDQLNQGKTQNVCVFADGEVDRSPTGTGVSARLALMYERGQVKMNEPVEFKSVVGSKFIGTAVGKAKFGPYASIIPKISGTAHICGRSEFFMDPDDPFAFGFRVSEL